MTQIKEIMAKSGITFELNNVWYKTEYSEVRTVNEEEPMELQRYNLWESVNGQVDSKVIEIYDSIGKNK